MPSVLEGIRVLDLSWGRAGPVTGMLLPITVPTW